MADKNDLLRQLNEAKSERKNLLSEIAGVSKKAADEKRSFDANEETKYQEMLDKDGLLQSDIRSHQDAINSIEASIQEDAETAEEIRSGKVTVNNAFASDEYRSEFANFLRTGDASGLEEAKRSLSGSTPTKGQEIVPIEFFAQVEKRIKEQTSLGQLINMQTIGSRDARFAIKTGISVAKPRDEGEAYGESDPSLGQKTVQVYNFGHITKVTEELLADGFTNVESFIAEDQAEAYANSIEAFGLQGEDAFTQLGLTLAEVQGKVPQGLLNDPDIPELETDVSGALSYDDIINLTEDVSSSVAARSSFIVHKSVTKTLRLLKDADGRPLWQPNLQLGRPAVFAGHEVHRSDFMPEFAAGNTPIMFGDFSRVTAYMRQMMTILRLNELYRASGEIGFRGSFRLDLLAKQPAALRKLTIKA